MIRFFRYLLITVIILVILAYTTAWLVAEKAVDRMYGPITTEFIGVFGPGVGDEYGYDVNIQLWPPMVIISDLYINADVLRVDLDTWQDARLGIGRIELELVPLVKEEEIIVKDISGRRLVGLLSNAGIADHLERNSPGIRDLTISEYREQCRILGDFGLTTIVPITLLGDWIVDDRGVATFESREYYNPDSDVPEGYIRIIEEQNSFDIRVEILGEGLVVEELVYESNGLWISAVEQ